MELIHWLYQITGAHDQDFFGVFLVWNAVLTVVALAAYVRNGSSE